MAIPASNEPVKLLTTERATELAKHSKAKTLGSAVGILFFLCILVFSLIPNPESGRETINLLLYGVAFIALVLIFGSELRNWWKHDRLCAKMLKADEGQDFLAAADRIFEQQQQIRDADPFCTLIHQHRANRDDLNGKEKLDQTVTDLRDMQSELLRNLHRQALVLQRKQDGHLDGLRGKSNNPNPITHVRELDTVNYA
jgi:hypothetical protein